jgi:hypothetical protein
MNQTLATFAKIKASVGRQYNARMTMYDQTPESLCAFYFAHGLSFSASFSFCVVSLFVFT